jgi:ankyrin repeat protein
LTVLLARGVDANVLNSRGLSPLRVAVNKGRWELTPTLLSHGADPALKDGETFLTALNMVEMLLAEPDHVDPELNCKNFNIEKTVEALRSAQQGK